MRLAAGLCPDPLGELKRSPRPPSRKTGPTTKGRGKERGSSWEAKVGDALDLPTAKPLASPLVTQQYSAKFSDVFKLATVVNRLSCGFRGQ